MRGKSTAAGAQMIARRLAPSLEPLDTTDLAAILIVVMLAWVAVPARSQGRRRSTTATTRLVMFGLGRHRMLCDRATGQGELKTKERKKVKQNEITWSDQIAVAGLGPRAVLAAAVVGSSATCSCLVSHAHAYARDGYGRQERQSSKNTSKRTRAKSMGRGRQERQQGLAFPRLPGLALLFGRCPD
jgi:hypothetical protein